MDELELDPLVAYPDDPIKDTVHQPYSAYLQGYEAGQQGVFSSLNPYKGVCEMFWEEGRQDGEDEAHNQQKPAPNYGTGQSGGVPENRR